MGILDSILSGNQPPQPAAPPVAPPAPPQNYGDFIQRLLAASNAGISAKAPLSGRGLFNLLTGNDRDAANTAVAAGAPSAWQQFQQGQSATQNAQLGTANQIASTSAMTGAPIDPNNIPAAIPGLTAAYGGVMNGGSPAGAPGAGQASDPLMAQRAFYLRMGKMLTMQGNAAMAKEFFALANNGAPADTAILPNGAVGDGVTGRPVSSDVGALLAHRAGQVAVATGAGQQAGVNSQTAVNVIGRNGPMVVPQSRILANGAGETGADGKPNWLPADSPTYKVIQGTQQKEVGDARNDAQLATTGLDTATQLYNAANGLYTGKGAEVEQGVRKTLQMVSQLTGTPVPQSVANDTSKFEQLKYAALNFVQNAAHGFSPRAAVQVVKLIQAAKPGDTTSPKGLQDIIKNQILPAYMRARAVYGATDQYYQKNPLATDASAKIPNQLPITSFGVKDLHSAQPGDYFIDPHSGNLRQRPVQ